MNATPATAALLSLLLWAGAARAQPPAAECLAVADDRDRLACYDRALGRVAAPAGPAAVLPAAAAAEPAPPAADAGSYLVPRWDLDGRRAELYVPRAYRPVYFLPVTWTDRVNRRPTSPTPDHTVLNDLELRSTETKYQLSLKVKLGQNLFGPGTSLWAAYTQSSRWQVYNGADSRPFRETNYEPELMLVWPLQAEVLGWQLRMGSLAVVHQSNGRSLPLSRSWNRVIGTLALERGDWVAEFRPWLRISEDPADDDNPDIGDHIGRAELLLGRYWGDHVFSLQLRHSLRGGDRSRGSAQLDWVFPVTGALHGYFQVFSGHGESMIDYNARQTKVGLGVTIAGWR
jgi:phospholipase A1/A2